MVLSGVDRLTEIACYHAQQCAEKYLKGYLVASGKPFKFVHELAYLVSLCAEADGGFAELLDSASELQDYATEVRYPVEEFESPSEDDAQAAISRAQEIRSFVRDRVKAS